MGIVKIHLPVKYFCAVTYTKTISFQDILNSLQVLFPNIDTQSDIYDFDRFTDYYKTEMGINLNKCFISNKVLDEISRLPWYKINSNLIEAEFLRNSKRQVNLDPGYITEAKLVLATTKDYSHRLYLSDGIFGDLHMVYSGKSYKPQPWTYPDYKHDAAAAYFNELRRIYREQLQDYNSRKLYMD